MNPFDEQLRAGFEQTLLVAGNSRDFVISDIAGAPFTKTIDCIWSVGENTAEMITVSPNGVFFKADVLLTLRACELPARPRPFTSVIESPPGSKWQVVEVNVDYEVYHIKLSKNAP